MSDVAAGGNNWGNSSLPYERRYHYFLFNVVASAGSMLAILRFFGEKISGHVLDRRLQKEKEHHEVALTNLKHEQDAKIEELRANIAHLADRGKNSNQREYLDLSTIWEKFVDLYYATRVCVIAPMRYPRLNSMAEGEVSEFLDTTELEQRQRAQVLHSKDREGSFSRITRWRYIAKAGSEYYEFSLMLHKLGIFVPEELKEQFADDAEACNKAIAQTSTEFDTGPL